MDVYEKDLKIAYSNRAPNFEELLKKDDTVTIGQQNLRKLAIKMYKISNDFSPIFMKDMATQTHILFNTRSTVKVEMEANRDFKCTKKSNFELPAIKTVSYGLESIRCFTPKIWKLVLGKLKEITSLELFKKKLNVLNLRIASNCCRKSSQDMVY